MIAESSTPQFLRTSMYFLKSLSMYSKTSMSLFSICMMSCNDIIFSCLSSFTREISQIAVEGIPSSLSRWIFLSIMNSLVYQLHPLNTCDHCSKNRQPCCLHLQRSVHELTVA